MKKYCAWCKQEMPGLSSQPDSPPQITHGICSLCMLRETNDNPRSIRELISYIAEPVFVIDSHGIISAANAGALQALGKKSASEVENLLGGEAFECSYSTLPGGCGKTEHCLTCAIRNTVTDTLRTGKKYTHVPAFQSLKTPEGDKIMRFLISTERLGQHILLRIDQFSERLADY